MAERALQHGANQDVGIREGHEELLVDPDRRSALCLQLRLKVPEQAGLTGAAPAEDEVMEPRLHLLELAARRGHELNRPSCRRRSGRFLKRHEERVDLARDVGGFGRFASHTKTLLLAEDTPGAEL